MPKNTKRINGTKTLASKASAIKETLKEKKAKKKYKRLYAPKPPSAVSSKGDKSKLNDALSICGSCPTFGEPENLGNLNRRSPRRTESDMSQDVSSSIKGEGKVRKRSAVKRRQKIRFYQTSTLLPTSRTTFFRAIKQAYEILKESGYIKEEETRGDRKRSNVSPSKKFAITKDALIKLHEMWSIYLSWIIMRAQEISDNNDKVIVKSKILDLAHHYVTQQKGPRWNMKLKPLHEK
jgi:hypothetical protein